MVKWAQVVSKVKMRLMVSFWGRLLSPWPDQDGRFIACRLIALPLPIADPAPKSSPPTSLPIAASLSIRDWRIDGRWRWGRETVTPRGKLIITLLPALTYVPHQVASRPSLRGEVPGIYFQSSLSSTHRHHFPLNLASNLTNHDHDHDHDTNPIILTD